MPGIILKIKDGTKMSEEVEKEQQFFFYELDEDGILIAVHPIGE
jgi:hypothetical protein